MRDYSRALVSEGEELENLLLRLESALGKTVKHGCQLCKNILLVLFIWTNIWHTNSWISLVTGNFTDYLKDMRISLAVLPSTQPFVATEI